MLIIHIYIIYILYYRYSKLFHLPRDVSEHCSLGHWHAAGDIAGSESSVQQWTKEEANKALDRWLQMCHLLFETLWCDSDNNLEVTQLFVTVGYNNGRKNGRTFEWQDGPTTGAECRLRIVSALRKLVPGWGSLPKYCQRYDEVTHQSFSLHTIKEIHVEIKVSRYLSSTDQTENLSTVSNWKYTGQFFNFHSVAYGAPRLSREIRWDPQRVNGPYTI